jgi:hypothetical protein
LFVHLRGLQLAHDDACRRLRAFIEEGIRSGKIPAENAFPDLRAEANKIVAISR